MVSFRECATEERQLVCLARVLLQRSKIVILDEPTSHVDPQTGQIIWNVVREKLKESTVNSSSSEHHQRLWYDFGFKKWGGWWIWWVWFTNEYRISNIIKWFGWNFLRVTPNSKENALGTRLSRCSTSLSNMRGSGHDIVQNSTE